jgi:hypothetical protein
MARILSVTLRAPMHNRLPDRLARCRGRREIGMFQRIQPLSLFLRDMLRDDVSQLLDQRQLPVLREEVGIE